MNAAESGVGRPPRIATSRALSPASTTPASIHVTHTPAITRQIARSEAKGIRVFEDHGAGERTRRHRPESVGCELRIEPFVVDQPKIGSLGKGIPQPNVEVERVCCRVVLNERVARFLCVERAADAQPRHLDIRRLMSRWKAQA